MMSFLGDDAEENRSQGKVHVNGLPIIRDSLGRESTLGLEGGRFIYFQEITGYISAEQAAGDRG